MALFGPRLDRPTALGDEGRPRATSLTLASVLVFGLLVVATTCPWAWGVRFDGWVPELIVPSCAALGQFTLGLATATGLTAAGVALLNRERFVSLFIGQVIFLPAGTALVGGLGLLVFTSPAYGLLFVGFATAMVALASSWTDTTSAESVRPALFQEGMTYLSILLWGFFVAVLALSVFLVRAVVLGSTQPTVSLILFLVFVFVAILCFRLGLRWLPIRQLTPRSKRDAVDTTLGRIRLASTVVALASLAGVIVAVGLAILGVLSLVYGLVPPISTLFQALSAAPVVVVVLGIGLVALAGGVVALLIRRLTRPVDRRTNRVIVPFVAGLFLTIGMLPFTFSLLPVPFPPLVAIVLVIVGPIGLYLLGWTLVIAEYLGVLPSRAGGPALAAGGMVVATIGTALAGLPGPVVLVTAAVAMVVWDVSAFGLGVTAELGHMPETRRLELFHALIVLGVGVAAVVGLSLLDLLRTTVAGRRPMLLAAALAVLGVLVLLVPLRGYVVGEAVD